MYLHFCTDKSIDFCIVHNKFTYYTCVYDVRTRRFHHDELFFFLTRVAKYLSTYVSDLLTANNIKFTVEC